MDNFDDIKQVWRSADISALPGAATIRQTIKRYRLAQILKTAAFIVLILLLAATMLRVVFFYNSKLVTTRMGEACILLAIFILLSVNIGSLKRMSLSNSYSNSDFLVFLKEEKLRLIKLQRKIQPIGFIIASIGLSLYIFEEVHKELFVMLLSYAGIFLWCCFSWFILRPKAMKRKTEKFNETISKLEQLLKQLQNQSN